MNKATDVKPGNDRNGEAVDRRRGMKLVATSVPRSTRSGFNIGVSPNVFSEVRLSREAVKSPPAEDSQQRPRPNAVKGTVRSSLNSTTNFAIGAATGLLIAGILRFVIGRRKR